MLAQPLFAVPALPSKICGKHESAICSRKRPYVVDCSTVVTCMKLHKKRKTYSKDDLAKAILSEIEQAEREIHRMIGAIKHAELQLACCQRRDCCPLCYRGFSDVLEKQQFIDRYREKIKRSVDFVKTSKFNEQRLRCINRLIQLNAYPENGVGTIKRVKSLRQGRIDAIRAQKFDSLQNRTCKVCERPLSISELASFLSVVDRKMYDLRFR